MRTTNNRKSTKNTIQKNNGTKCSKGAEEEPPLCRWPVSTETNTVRQREIEKGEAFEDDAEHGDCKEEQRWIRQDTQKTKQNNKTKQTCKQTKKKQPCTHDSS